MATVSDFSTASLSAARQLAGWNEFLQKAFPGILVNGNANFRGETRSYTLVDVSVSRIRSQRATVRRWKDGTAISASGRAKMHLQIEGFSTATQRGRTTSLSRGEASLILIDEPYELEISDRNEMLVFEFPIDCLEGVGLFSGDARYSPSPITGVLGDMAISLLHHARPDTIGNAEALALANGFKALLPLALNGRGPNQAGGIDLRQQIFDFIDANISDSALRTSKIANALGINPRDVQGIFADIATTPTAYVIERRLSLAAQRLTGLAQKPGMTDLALDLGFSDAAHFCRRFKSRYGVSPGSYARERSWH